MARGPGGVVAVEQVNSVFGSSVVIRRDQEDRHALWVVLVDRERPRTLTLHRTRPTNRQVRRGAQPLTMRCGVRIARWGWAYLADAYRVSGPGPGPVEVAARGGGVVVAELCPRCFLWLDPEAPT
jgi:hypothetical protein